MITDVTLLLATEKDAELLHQMQYEAFLPLYMKYHDDETSPVKETIDRVIWKLTHPDSEYYIKQADGKNVGAVRVKRSEKQTDSESKKNVKYISPIYVLPGFQNRGIAIYMKNAVL